MCIALLAEHALSGPRPSPRKGAQNPIIMKAVNKAYESLWNLIDKEEIHLKTLDFSAICERIGAYEPDLDALIQAELGYSGYELLAALRHRHFHRQ